MKIKSIILFLTMLSGVFVYAKGDFVYDSKGKRDPFLPLVSKDGYLVSREAEVVAAEMNLEGIIYDQNGKSLAIINGQILKVGDTIGNYVIIEIARRSVTLLKDAEKSVLELKQEVE